MEMTTYEPGTPCWVDAGVPSTDAAAVFYGGLFGWELDPGSDETGGYRQARLQGHSVAGFGPQMSPGLPFWATYVSVVSADATAELVTANGGQVVLEPMDVMDVGRMAVCSDPAGALFSLWQAGTHPGAALVNEPGTLCWNELTTRQPDAAKAFYGAVFGWGAHDSEMGETTYTEWQLGGRSIGGMMPMAGDVWDGIPDHWMVYFAIEDTDASCERVKQLGGAVQVEPFDIPIGRIAVVSDPAGAHFSVIALNAQPES